MLEIAVPELAFSDVGFAPEAEHRQLLAGGSSVPWLERVSMAAPVVVPLSAEQAYADPRVAGFFAGQSASFRFALVRLACAFTAKPDEPITMAVLEIALDPASGVGAPAVIDMEPSSVAEPSDLKTETEGGVTIEYAGGKLGFTGKRHTERPVSELFMVAAGIGQPRVGWELYDLPGMKIGGLLVFNLIVQTSVGRPATGRITTTVQVQRKKFGLVPYRALLDDHPTGRFVCPG